MAIFVARAFQPEICYLRFSAPLVDANAGAHRRTPTGEPRTGVRGCAIRVAGGCVFDYEHEHEHEHDVFCKPLMNGAFFSSGFPAGDLLLAVFCTADER